MSFSINDIEGDIESWLRASERQFTNIKPGLQKQVVWASDPGEKTAISLVYVHGFSASLQETRPMPDLVAAGLGANLFYTRLTGHARDGVALSEATAGAWRRDMAEAIEIGRRLGDEVVVIGTSTGGTLAAMAALDPELMARVKGVVLISPNFRIKAPAARLLTWPFARYWAPLLMGAERAFEPANEDHARYWTSRYPSTAVFQMAAMVKHAERLDYARASVPALFILSDHDQVIRADIARRVAQDWGAQLHLVAPGPGVDPSNHVIAGDILSPAQTAPVSEAILAWVEGISAGN